MLSTALELLGLALLAAGTYVLAGMGFALVEGGASVLFVGAVTDDAEVYALLRRGALRVRLYGVLLRRRLRALPAHERPTTPQPRLQIDPEADALARHSAQQAIRRLAGTRS